MDFRKLRTLLAVVTVASLAAGCSGGSTVLTPVPKGVEPGNPTATPTASSSPKATSAPTATPTATAAAALTGTAPQSGQVTVPSGVAIAVTKLIVTNGTGNTVPASSGAFTIPAYPGGPVFTMVTDQAGNPVLAGFLSPTDPTIDSLSTAKLLAYFAGAFYTLPSPYRAELIDAVASAPGFDKVQAAVVAALQANPAGLATNAGVTNALTTFITGLSAPANSSPAARMLRIATAVRRRMDVTVSPQSASGVTVVNDFPDGVHFMNTYRRAAQAYIDQDSYVDQNGTRQSAPQNDIVAPVPISAVSGLSNVSGSLASAAAGYFSGATAYTPTNTASTPLSNLANAMSTRYLITIVGAGKPNNARSLRQEESDAQKLLTVQQLVQDFIVPIVASFVIPVNSSHIDDALGYDGGNAALTDFITTLTTAAPQIYTLMDAGQVDDAFTAAMNAILTSNTLQALILQYFQNQIAGELNMSAAQAFFAQGGALVNKLNILSGALVATDVAVVTANIGASNDADQFVVDVSADKVTLTPATANVVVNGTQVFTANVPSQSDSGTTVVWTWTDTATYGHISDGIAGHQDNFSSSSNTVTYTANASGTGTDTITVTAFLVQGQNRTQIGSPQTATVTLQGNPICNGNFAQNFQCWTQTTIAPGYFSGYPRSSVADTDACLNDPDQEQFYQTDVPGGAESLLSQTFTVPTGKPTLYLLAWGNLDPVTATLEVTPAGGTEATLGTFTPITLSSSEQDCSGSTPQVVSFDMSAYAGMTVLFGIDVTSSGNDGTLGNFTDFGFSPPSGMLVSQARKIRR